MHHDAIPIMYENYKAGEIGQEKEAKDASSTIDVKQYVVVIFLSFRSFCFVFKVIQLCCVIYVIGHCNWSSVFGQYIAPKEG